MQGNKEHIFVLGWLESLVYLPTKGLCIMYHAIVKQAGGELCQAQHNLGYLPVAWNFALAWAAYSASCG